jgi:L-aspartate oxidase
MARDVGVVRNEAGLQDSLSQLARIASTADTDLAIENAALSAMLVADAALRRHESRGGHCRSDFLQSDPAQQHHSATTMDDLKERTGWPEGRRRAVARR